MLLSLFNLAVAKRLADGTVASPASARPNEQASRLDLPLRLLHKTRQGLRREGLENSPQLLKPSSIATGVEQVPPTSPLTEGVGKGAVFTLGFKEARVENINDVTILQPPQGGLALQAETVGQLRMTHGAGFTT